MRTYQVVIETRPSGTFFSATVGEGPVWLRTGRAWALKTSAIGSYIAAKNAIRTAFPERLFNFLHVAL